MVEQGVHQRAVKIAGGRMDDQACRLVDDDQVFVLEHDAKRNVLRLAPRRGMAAGTSMAKALPAATLSEGWPAGLPADK